MRNLLSLLFGVLFMVLSSALIGQMTTTNAPPNNTATNLVNNVLLGNGVTAFNIQVYGAPIQYGFFQGGNTSIGIDSGLVLITGDINEVPLPPGTPGLIPVGATSGGHGPASMGTAAANDLLTVAQSVPPLINQTFSVTSANDACVIEFDFVATADSISFNYVFASDEYDSWINSQYNDVFGFFISGPGITGPYNSPPGFPGGSKNLAIVPGTNPPLPITISSVNGGLNGTYHVTNLPNNTNLSMNGYTTVLTAKEAVNPCDTFHIRLAIADGTDRALSSAVFLEANSFRSRGINIVAVPSYTNVGGNDSTLFEGCGSVDVVFTRGSVTQADTVAFNIGGTAINGIDYSTVPNQVIFPAGQDSATLSFTVFNDNVSEGIETFILSVTNVNVCTSSGGDSLYLNIFDPLPITSTTTNDTTINCTADSILITAQGTGLDPFSFQWNTGDTTASIWVDSNQTTNYIVTITDACNINSTEDTVSINVFTPPFSTVSKADTINCSVDSLQIGVGVIDGYPQISYLWNNGRRDSSIWVKTTNDSTFFVTVQLACNNQQEVDSFRVNVVNPPFTVSMNDDSMNCTIDSVLIAPQINGFIPGFSYQWSNGKTDSAIWVHPTATTNYFVTVTDACAKNAAIASNTVSFFNSPMVLTTNNPTFDCFGDTVELKASVVGGYPGYKFLWDFGGTNPIEKVVGRNTRTYAVRVTDTCRIDTVLGFVEVTYRNYSPMRVNNIPNPFLNCPGDTVILGPATVSGGSGDYSVSWNNFLDTIPTKIVSVDSTAQFLVKAKDFCTLDSTQRIVTVGIKQHNPLKVEVSPNQSLCKGDTALLTAKAVDGAGFYQYFWSSGSVDTFITVNPEFSAAYSVTVTDDCGNLAFDNIRVSVRSPIANFDYRYADAQLVEFINNSSPDVVKNYWDFGNGDTSRLKEPQVEYALPDEHRVMLMVENAIGCKDSAILYVEEPLQVFIPNSFTPNGDGLNDQFGVVSQSVLNYYLVIYDRWGNMVYESRDPDESWHGNLNGSPLPTGVYAYRLEIEGTNKQIVKKMGSIMLLQD